ncbi:MULTISPECIES: GNAT family N-acetyltransferase [Rhizobium]|uniref:N-acetyltransferase n=1 Tax=Rhizobium tropici TaxID=398 RepID=A0A329Y3K3_RHITR|nr:MULTISPECIES: GNAT family N-acetyltransferase [Rhizobium]MBB3285773.1 RimJ/RimL family protein N-acetyltransferase [Rhizobium sp. BK252]MBB3400513.1 RimJ/RimL family protein N-acetyltransferase [Rhizobium sp. BK289]MBB3413092.1 RimJ/RimL family protein N-acetyltransferase [Rhizobium sp. BK284]MBB3480979.1 RimJ/RimL family protein N-acetyltransferase [Rhizobium sp. BK347]MDK4721653.1 GNAT family N-acetyltransferase [Rhizobium sp. CNPSo 3968]
MDASVALRGEKAAERSFDLRLPAAGFASHARACVQPLIVSPGQLSGSFRVEQDGLEVASGFLSRPAANLLVFDTISSAASPASGEDIINAVLEAILICNPHLVCFEIELADGGLAKRLTEAGAIERRGDRLIVRPESFFQQARPWIGSGAAAYPEVPVLTNNVLHPQRPPKPVGSVYNRFIPWLNTQLGFHVADVEADLPHFHRWMNDPRVAAIWEDSGDLSYHRDFIAGRLADPRTLPLIGTFGGVPFGYFELYWAKEDRIGPHYDADGYDRGWHVAIGEDDFRGKAFVSAWLPSLMHYMFLADPRTRRIVGEPIHHHAQQIRNLDRSGFAKVKHIQFPHKKALLVMLLRERFFMDRLLSPDLTGLSSEDGRPVLGSLPRDAAR